jgi:hypothetical protein
LSRTEECGFESQLRVSEEILAETGPKAFVFVTTITSVKFLLLRINNKNQFFVQNVKYIFMQEKTDFSSSLSVRAWRAG